MLPSHHPILRTLRIANLWNGRAIRGGSPLVARRAAIWAEKVIEMHAALPPDLRVWFRLPDAGDRVVAAHSVEYPRYFPVQLAKVREPITVIPDPITPEQEAELDRRRRWLQSRLDL